MSTANGRSDMAADFQKMNACRSAGTDPVCNQRLREKGNANSLVKSAPLVSISDYFTGIVEEYDTEMLGDAEGCTEGYIKMGEIVAEHYSKAGKHNLRLLDLGCGTGLELEEIFNRVPDLAVTGIDLTRAMLERLRKKFSGKELRLICGSYFDVDLDYGAYGCAVSFRSMHFFTHDKKTSLYQRVYEALQSGGIYVECDYMVEKQTDEDFYVAENIRIRREQKLSPDDFYHYVTPCTVENQTAMLKAAGFSTVEQVLCSEKNTILVARKEE